MNDLVDIIRSLSSPLEPLPTSVEPVLPSLAGIRGVVFDIYGTLIISGSGDISLAVEENRDVQMAEALADRCFSLHGTVEGLSALFHEHIHVSQTKRRAQGIEYPEVEIRDIWRSFVTDLIGKGRLVCAEDAVTDELIELLAVTYECRVNPVWPMPELESTLDALRERGMLLGIVSNAQFCTPLIFPSLAGRDLDAFGFAADCGVWSYREREGKPSRRLYEKLAVTLEARGMTPEEVLYVGNDIRNDIWPAQKVGFKTALFAGDGRSLRWREDDPLCAGVKPDVIVTSLGQILGLL